MAFLTFDERMQELINNGIPEKGTSLYNWCIRYRQYYRNKKLSQKQIDAFKSVFWWDWNNSIQNKIGDRAREKFLSLAKNNGWVIKNFTKIKQHCIGICPKGHEIQVLPEKLKDAWRNKRKFCGCGICKKNYDSRIEITCAICNKKLLRKKSNKKGLRYCSYKCLSRASKLAKNNIKFKKGISTRENQKTIVGQNYGNWMVLGKEFHILKKWHVVCQCQCGFVNIVNVNDLITGSNKNCGVCKQLKIPKIKIGDKFKFLTAISDPFYDRFRSCNKWRVEVRCECGWFGNISTKLLLKNRIHHKGCKYYCQGSFSGSWKGFGDLSGQQYSTIKSGARNRNLELSVNISDCYKKLELQKNICCLTGWQISTIQDRKNKLQRTASLDRIDSTKGYTEDNIQWIHKHINISKWNLPQQTYVDFCHLVVSKKEKNLSYLNIEIWNRSKHFKGIGNLPLSYWLSVKNRSLEATSRNKLANNRIARKISLEISIEQAWNLYLEQNGRCALSGIPIYFALPGYGSAAHIFQEGEKTASLDRIDSTKGYTEDNVQWVHKYINIMKFDFSAQYFLQMCKAVSDKCLPSFNIENLLEPKKFIFLDYRPFGQKNRRLKEKDI